MTADSRPAARTVDPEAFRLDDKYTVEDGVIFLTGIQALTRVPLDQHRADLQAGLRSAGYISGYQGSPLGVYDLELGRQRDRLRAADVIHQPAVNEELGATAVMGTQLAQGVGKPRFDGVVGYWYGKAPGLDRASDALRHANTAGTHPNGGAVAFVGDDATAKSSTVPSSSEAALFDLGMPILVPGDVQDILDYGRHAVAMSRASGLWTAMKIATTVADGSGTASVARGRIEPVDPATTSGARPYHHEPHTQLIGAATLELERSLFNVRLDIAREYGRLNQINRVTQSGPEDSIGILAVGRMYQELRQALLDLGLGESELTRLGVRIMKVGMPFPLDDGQVKEFAHGLNEILVVEEKRAFVETQVKDVLYAVPDRPMVSGKRDQEGKEIFPIDGEFDAGLIARVLAGRLLGDAASDRARSRVEVIEAFSEPTPLPLARTPYYCSGCPHNTSTANLPEESLVGAGIGCSGMVMVMDESQVGDVTGVTQMGGEGAQWIGMAPFVDAPHFFQNLGDGTFMHSGSLAIRAAVAAGVDITYKLLYNSAIAMTGGQQPAGGALSVPEICTVLKAEGVSRILITTEDRSRYSGVELSAGIKVWDRSRSVEAQEELAATSGVTVLIHDQECATELRRKRKRGRAPEPAKRAFINERVCEGCGDCGDVSNCLSVVPVETEFGRKTKIHQASCNKDYSCLQGDCPSFLEVIPSAQASTKRVVPDLDRRELPEPTRRIGEDFTVRITGVGGTGVVSLAQILATAAHLDGRYVRALDQVGLAQKGGPVVSDLRILAEPGEISNRLGAADCDLYLGCDLLVAAEGRNLRAADPSRTVAVLSTTEVATGHMVSDPKLSFPPLRSLTDRVLSRVVEAESIYFPAQDEATKLFGPDQVANVMLLGSAYQMGVVPVDASAIERAITLNGTEVEMNVQAFRRGRQRVADPEAYAAVLHAEDRAPAPRELSPPVRAIVERVGAENGSVLQGLLERLVPELIGYQDQAYAQRYADEVYAVLAVEQDRVPGTTALTEAVAGALYKLMAYKDEAEVARLHLDPVLQEQIEAEFGPGATYAWKLHPPLFRTLGLKRKISLGPWFKPGYRTLYRMRKLRGTPFDPFGYTKVRRVEQELITEYGDLIGKLLASLNTENHSAAVDLAQLPDMVRGYENIKLANVDRYRARIEELMAEFESDASLVAS